MMASVVFCERHLVRTVRSGIGLYATEQCAGSGGEKNDVGKKNNNNSRRRKIIIREKLKTTAADSLQVVSTEILFFPMSNV